MKKFHIDRLLKLADYLQTVPREEFDIREWKRTNCQTVACACGHACSIPSFRRAGLRLQIYFNCQRYDPLKYCVEEITTFELVFGDKKNIYAAAAFFGIWVEEAQDLFHASGYSSFRITPKMVASKIRRFVKNKIKSQQKV